MEQLIIKINFQQACAQARKLEEAADVLDRIADRELEDTLAEVQAVWKGESAAAYCGKAEKIKGDISATGKKIRGIAENIRRKAKRIYEAEMEAERLARERAVTSGGGGAGACGSGGSAGGR